MATEGIKRLTNKQQELVSNNHSLIYGYAMKNGLDIEEYYDILAIALCKAAMAFNDDRGRFSTFAYSCMRNEVGTYWRKMQCSSSIPNSAIIHYESDPTSFDDGSDCYLDKLAHDKMASNILSDLISSEFINSLSDREQLIINMLHHGMTHKDIAERLSCKRQNISYHIGKLREKIVNHIYN